MMPQNLMAVEWAQFANRVLPKNAPEVQRREMKRAFYAGAHAIVFRLISSFAPEHEVTDTDLAVMEDLDLELRNFIKDVAEGRE
jgi:hypothetical protein